ncbi:MAG TPA: HD domain-containing protein [Planctomycetota bacterium]|nr:HD domain-containing protein [Planctomycetota bacterium]
MDLTPKLRCARAVAGRYPEELRHAEQVGRLCGQLFDALRPLHGLGGPERELLLCAALLHDIGLSVAVSGHHRASLQLILQADLPALNADERLVVANVARYHRKAHPSPKHGHLAALSPAAQALVARLAAILRIADGLDRLHEDAVTDLQVTSTGEHAWTLRIGGGGDLRYACWGARRKAGLFEEAYGVELRIEPGTEGKDG